MADLKITGLWRHAPNAISLARLFATPVLLLAAVARYQSLFKWLLLACLLSDILDGLIARVFHLRSRVGAFLDSTADSLVSVIALTGLCIFKASILAPHWVPLAILVTFYFMEAVIALWRYGRISSFHTTLVRVAAYLQGIFVMSLFLWGYSAWILYPMAVVSILAYTEELALVFLLPEWRADVRGIYWVISRKGIATP